MQLLSCKKKFFSILLLGVSCALFSNISSASTIDDLPTSSYDAAWTAGEKEEIQNTLESLIKEHALGGAHIGAAILPLNATAGEAIHHQGKKLFIPASTLKLLTTGAAFDVLNATHVFTTKILGAGNIQNGTLHGNLIVKGGGDPSFSEPWCKKGTLCLDDFAKKIREKGIATVTGDLIADVSLYTGPSVGPAWEWDDLSYYYATPVAPLSCDENTLEVQVLPGEKSGAPLRIISEPSGYFGFQNFGLTRGSKGRITILRELGEEVVTVRGQLDSKSKGVSAPVSVNNPSKYFLFRLRLALENAGVAVQGGMVVTREPAQEPTKVLAMRTSPPLREIATVVNRQSHNLFAEMLLHAIAVEQTEQGSFAIGASQITKWAVGKGASASQVVIQDGSGLSRKNLISPLAMATILRSMVDTEVFAEFYASIPVAGRHGSMRGRLRGTRGEGNLRAKVGYLTANSGLAGYAKDKKGRWFTFAVMVNNHGGAPRNARRLQDDIVTLIVGK